jgi:hypothetical protein
MGRDGLPLPCLPRLPIDSTDAIERLSTILRQLATFQTVRSMIDYQFYSPIPEDWFSVRLFNKDKPSENASSGNLQLLDGDSLRYAISNRTDSHAAHVHMLSLNASWTIGTLLWHVHLPPRQQRTGDLTMVFPSPVNDDDPPDAEDTILVIFCVGEQCSEQLVTSSEWLRSIYIPPVLLESGTTDPNKNGVPVWPFFVPPPNWLVKHFTVRTVQRPQGEGKAARCRRQD